MTRNPCNRFAWEKGHDRHESTRTWRSTTDNAASAHPVNLTIHSASVSRLLELLRGTLRSELQQILMATPVSPNQVASAQSSETCPLPNSTGLDLKTADRQKAADLRMALLMGKMPEDAGLLID